MSWLGTIMSALVPLVTPPRHRHVTSGPHSNKLCSLGLHEPNQSSNLPFSQSTYYEADLIVIIKQLIPVHGYDERTLTKDQEFLFVTDNDSVCGHMWGWSVSGVWAPSESWTLGQPSKCVRWPHLRLSSIPQSGPIRGQRQGSLTNQSKAETEIWVKMKIQEISISTGCLKKTPVSVQMLVEALNNELQVSFKKIRKFPV